LNYYIFGSQYFLSAFNLATNSETTLLSPTIMNLGDMTVGSDPEELFICPYDKVHVIRNKKMPYHLMKCRQNWHGEPYKVCPFDSNHEVPASDFMSHKQICKDRYLIEVDLKEQSRKDKESGIGNIQKELDVSEPSEDWEQEVKMIKKINRSWPQNFPLHQHLVVEQQRQEPVSVDTSNYSFHNTRAPRSQSMAFGDMSLNPSNGALQSTSLNLSSSFNQSSATVRQTTLRNN
jgi:hypothetical protein